MKKALVLIKSGFTLIELMIVIMVIGILMAATMRFGSGRIVDLKAQSLKEQFVGYYNDVYSQNMTSSFRDGKKYQQLDIIFYSWVLYSIDSWAALDSKLSSFVLQNLRFQSDWNILSRARLRFVPYHLGCIISDGEDIWDVLYFDFFVPENGKQYCFEIKAETCKLVETKCN